MTRCVGITPQTVQTNVMALASALIENPPEVLNLRVDAIENFIQPHRLGEGPRYSRRFRREPGSVESHRLVYVSENTAQKFVIEFRHSEADPRWHIRILEPAEFSER